MDDLIIRQRPMPRLVTPSDAPGWDWARVNAALAPVTFTTFFVLLFRPWETVLAPKGTPCHVQTFHGAPIYNFKEWRGRTYSLHPEPAF